MSNQMKQVIFGALAVVLVAFAVIVLRSPGSSATPVPPSGAVNVPVGAGNSNSGPDPAVAQRISALQNQVQNNPKDPKALADLASALFDAQQFAQAADTYNRLLDVAPNNTDARIGLGRAYFWQGMSATAIQEFRKVIAADPNNVDAHYQLGLALSHGSPADIDGAVAEWNTVIKLAPDSDSAKKSQQFIASFQQQK